MVFERYKRFTYPQEFEETLELFMKLIAKDEKILQRIPKRYQKHGLFSPAVQMLIETYVNVKSKKEDKKEETQDATT